MENINAKAFFDTRAADIKFSPPSVQNLCYVAGRDPRIWGQQAIYDDLMRSIREDLSLDQSDSLLEVGCACGFLAQGLAAMCREYVGIDVAPNAIAVARNLNIPHASFRVADGTALPFADASFDRALCQHVFINFLDFSLGATLIREMYRTLKPGGALMIGCVPDKACDAELPVRVQAVSEYLRKEFPDTPPQLPPATVWGNLSRLLYKIFKKAEPAVTCYSFNKEDFLTLGKELGSQVAITLVHTLHPYAGLRFNAIFTKPKNENL